MDTDLAGVIEELLLPRVMKPARYIGREYNASIKPWEEADVHMAFCFPDLYEIGMSHLGLQILYGLVNAREGFHMERAFAPWTDMEELLRLEGLPLFSLESRRPLSDFDVLGFTLQYELSFTNILNMLDLSGVPLHAADRGDEHPLVIAGGPCGFNPEPLADFIDCFLLGEGEELLPEFLDLVRSINGSRAHAPRREVLEEACKIQGIYVPSFYKPRQGLSGSLQAVEPIREGAPRRVKKRAVKDLDQAYFPERTIVPFLETVHDRVALEVLRGCTRGCRFCQAGVLYRPVRERSVATLKKQAGSLLKATGYDEVSLTSLSTADFSRVEELARELDREHGARRVGVSLPSLRVDAFSVGLARELTRVRRAGLTFAPEAGTQRLRNVINKGVDQEDILEAARAAFESGWTSLKLYFMIGLPTEGREDLEGINQTAREIVRVGEQVRRGRKGIQVTVSVSSFVPKSHTPFQWFGQDRPEVLREKQEILKGLLRDRRLTFRWHDVENSHLEAALARGDRRLGAVLEGAWRRGARLDGWSEHFRPDAWEGAFQAAGLEPSFFANCHLEREEPLPWEHIDTGVTKAYLWREYRRALAGELTPDCRQERCPGCGVCGRLDLDLAIGGGVLEGAGRYRV